MPRALSIRSKFLFLPALFAFRKAGDVYSWICEDVAVVNTCNNSLIVDKEYDI